MCFPSFIWRAERERILAEIATGTSGRNKRSRGFQVRNLKFLAQGRLIFYVGEWQQLARSAIRSNDNHVLAGAGFMEKLSEMFLSIG
jgi:hypothetical protein